MPSTAVLFFLRWNDREGIVPVNTYSYRFHKNELEELNLLLSSILEKFVSKSPNNAMFWLEDNAGFDPEEEEDYGYVFSEQESDDNILLPDELYEAARKIAVDIVTSNVWKENVIDEKDGGDYILTDFTVDEIPETAPQVEDTVPVDPRFAVGDTLLDSAGRRWTYKGVLYHPLNKKLNTDDDPDFNKRTVLVGVECNEYVNEKAVAQFLEANAVEVHPLPLIATRHLRKGSKWFARSLKHKKVEGYGATQVEAKQSLVVSILLKG